MKIKTNIDSVVFNDGFLYVLNVLQDGSVDYTSKRLYYYGRRTVTQKRLDEAMQVQQRIDLCVHIPYVKDNVKEDNVICIGTLYYRVLTIQHILTSSPPITVLTLERWTMDGGEE